MNALNSFITAVCAACVIIGAAYLICPDGSMQKPVKYVLSLVFIAVIISSVPIARVKFDLNFKAYEYSEKTEDELLISDAEYVYGSVLKKAGVNFNKITVCTDKTESGGISIIKIAVSTNEPEYKVKEALNAAGVNYEVTVQNE